jgi:hypothetical protein
MPEGSDSVQTDQTAPPFYPRKTRTVEDADRASQTLAAIRKFVHDSFEEGVDYDVIPGTKRRSLMKPGAEKIALFFDSRPSYRIVSATEFGEGHVEYIIKCEFVEFGSLEIVGEGDGSCSTMEKKYRWRSSERRCPDCKAAAIIKGKQEYGGGYVCFERKGGCRAKFKDDDKRITEQALGTVENPDIHDERNTALKMAEKRACVAAGLAAGCLSGFFTQDIEERYEADQRARASETDTRAEPQERPQERPLAQERREEPRGDERPSEAAQSAQEPNPAAPAPDPTRPKASLQKILSLAFRDETDKIKEFMAEATTSLFGKPSALNDLAKEDARTLLEAVQKGKIKVPATH